MAAIIPSTPFQSRTISLGLSSLDRKAIEQQIETLIDLLDQLDGDPDLEEDELACDPLDLGEADVCMKLRPLYGIDQSRGPLNAHQARELQLQIAYRASA
jgi:hypothetical protein